MEQSWVKSVCRVEGMVLQLGIVTVLKKSYTSKLSYEVWNVK